MIRPIEPPPGVPWLEGPSSLMPLAPRSVNHSVPCGPAAMSQGAKLLLRTTLASVMVPPVVIWPMVHVPFPGPPGEPPLVMHPASVNQRVRFGPAAMNAGMLNAPSPFVKIVILPPGGDAPNEARIPASRRKAGVGEPHIAIRSFHERPHLRVGAIDASVPSKIGYRAGRTDLSEWRFAVAGVGEPHVATRPRRDELRGITACRDASTRRENRNLSGLRDTPNVVALVA